MTLGKRQPSGRHWRSAALLCLVALPATADEFEWQVGLDAPALIDGFAAWCSWVASDPVQAANGPRPLYRTGAVTTDGALIQVTESHIPLDGGNTETLIFLQMKAGNETRTNCVISRSFMLPPATPLPIPEMADLVQAAAPALLGGEVTALGSEVNTDGQTVQLRAWTTGTGAPPVVTLRLEQAPNYVALSLTRTEALSE